MRMRLEADSMQNGSIMRSERPRGPDVWEFRWREPGADGRRKHRRMVVGPVDRFRDKDSVMRATAALRRDINMANVRGKGKPITLIQIGRSLFSARARPQQSMEDALHPAGLPRVPAQMDHSTMGRLHIDSHSRGRDRALAALLAFGAFDVRKDPQRDERFIQSRITPRAAHRNPVQWVRQSARRKKVPAVL